MQLPMGLQNSKSPVSYDAVIQRGLSGNKESGEVRLELHHSELEGCEVKGVEADLHMKMSDKLRQWL